jgi:hypothetical protein
MKFQEILDKCIQTGLNPRIPDEKIAEKHNVPLDIVRNRIKEGIKIELEHTSNKKIAETIASHHIFERINFYRK